VPEIEWFASILTGGADWSADVAGSHCGPAGRDGPAAYIVLAFAHAESHHIG
jgi:hypothetical protein